MLIASNPLLAHIVNSAVTRAGFEKRGEIIRLVTTMRGGDRPKGAHQEFKNVTVMPRSMWEPWIYSPKTTGWKRFKRICAGGKQVDFADLQTKHRSEMLLSRRQRRRGREQSRPTRV